MVKRGISNYSEGKMAFLVLCATPQQHGLSILKEFQRSRRNELEDDAVANGPLLSGYDLGSVKWFREEEAS